MKPCKEPPRAFGAKPKKRWARWPSILPEIYGGAYGSGKSHSLYCLRDTAWERGSAVVKVGLSPVETPYNDQKLVYSALARNLIWHEGTGFPMSRVCRVFWRAPSPASSGTSDPKRSI